MKLQFWYMRLPITRLHLSAGELSVSLIQNEVFISYFIYVFISFYFIKVKKYCIRLTIQNWWLKSFK